MLMGIACSPSGSLTLLFAWEGRHFGQLSCSFWAQAHTFSSVGSVLRTQMMAFQLHKVVSSQSLIEH